VPGLYAAGECDYAYHGANRLGANSLLSCIYAGMIAGPAMIQLPKNAAPKKATCRRVSCRRAEAVGGALRVHLQDGRHGEPYVIGRDMGELMQRVSTVVKHNGELEGGRPADPRHEDGGRPPTRSTPDARSTRAPPT